MLDRGEVETLMADTPAGEMRAQHARTLCRLLIIYMKLIMALEVLRKHRNWGEQRGKLPGPLFGTKNILQRRATSNLQLPGRAGLPKRLATHADLSKRGFVLCPRRLDRAGMDSACQMTRTEAPQRDWAGYGGTRAAQDLVPCSGLTGNPAHLYKYICK